ncbi:TIGR02996 domain-containing protein [Gemmata sp. JC673]|uniref:TIGR02996 domain-containing protein n=1 Tax=Gemmata algarum TaxID=2975278 RepID=A0ABU5F1E4_9BACT|nr:TIGR02996 domain-containing protein [Gemmata algarum]MDY3559933.1 TIGR02996 domain-containing protein [Gemmata algarum]
MPPPLNPDLLGLLASCRAAPADDTPRLVLADWLDEHADVSGLPTPGDARARAALLRVQVELARPTCDERHGAALRAEERRLLMTHAESWLGSLPRRLYELAHPVFGFAQQLAAARPPQPFTFEPLTPFKPWRFTRGLLNIDLRAETVADPELGAWFASPLAAWTEEACVDVAASRELERLALPDPMRPYFGVRLAVGAAEFPTLLRPRPDPEDTDERRCRRLLRSAKFGLVRELVLFPPALDAGFLRLMAGANVASVQRLAVRASLSDTDAAFLASAALTGLSALNVSATELTAAGVRRIAHAPHFRQLVSLVAYRNELGCDGLVALVESPLAQTLNVLEVQNTGIGDRGSVALARSPLLGRLHGPGLNLSMNPITDEGARALAACEHLARFRELILRDCTVGDAGAAALASSPNVADLSILDLWQNRIGDAGARALAASPHLDGLDVLSLRDNRITAGGAAVLRARFGDRVKL